MSFALLHGLLASSVVLAAAESYPAAFFTPYAPQTALDMVQRLPGFRLDLGEQGVRGFAEAGGNVLVDGARPASKSGGLWAALSAIPARQVARIEIVRDGAAASEVSGQAVVANIVRVGRRSDVTPSGRLSATEGALFGNAAVTVGGELGGFDVASRTIFDATGERSHGTRTQSDPAGVAKGRQALDYRTDYPELSERLTLDGVVGGGRLKAAALLARARLSEGFTFVDRNDAERFPKRTGRWRGELSGEWARPIDGRTLKLLALTSFTDLDARSLSQRGASTATLRDADLFESRSASRETILRATLARTAAAAWRPEAGAEVAWNRLDSRSTSTTFGASPTRSTAATLVSELRGEVFATLDWRPAPPWAVTTGVAYEMSRLHAQGANDHQRRFGFLKPRLTVSYKPDPRSDLRLSVRRSVGQLSFGDFVASANLAEGKESEGNVELGPDHRTRIALDFDRRFGRRGAFNLGLFHDWRGDVLEAAVLPTGAFAMTNVRSARVWGGSANLELPLDRFAPGGWLKLSYSRQASRVADPLTGRRRVLTGSRPETLTVAFRQDLDAAKLSWGVDYAAGSRTRYWYADEARSLRHAQDLGAYVETTRFAGAKLRLQLDGLTGTRNTYDRALYARGRTGAPSQREVWDIRTPLAVTASVSRTF